MDHAYFPTTFHASLLYTMIYGATAEMDLVGNEGVLGVALFMGGDTTPNRALVQGAGQALKLPGSSETSNSAYSGNGHAGPFESPIDY